jgi:hypothetical protein
MKEKRSLWLAVAMMAVFAVTRWPGVLPDNFSAAYALAFCAGVFFEGWTAWVLPMATLLGTDILLNVFYYHSPVFDLYFVAKNIGFVLLIALGRCFSPRANFLKLLAGGVLGAVLFYLITNTASWLYNPAYAKTLAGWIQALTTGLPGFPPTWVFFLKTLLGGGLFTGLFAGAVRLSEQMESKLEKEGAPEPQKEEEETPEPEPEEAKP